MDEKTYRKTLKEHDDKVFEQNMKLHTLIADMIGAGVSKHEVIGMLEFEKMWLFKESSNVVTVQSLYEDLQAIMDGEEE